MSNELDKGLVTSVIAFFCLLVFGYFTGDTIGKSEVMGFAGALAGLIVWYYNEKHNSDLISSSGEVNADLVLGADEEELINPDYYEEKD